MLLERCCFPATKQESNRRRRGMTNRKLRREVAMPLLAADPVIVEPADREALGSAGASPFDTTVGVAGSHDFACRRQYWRPRERAGTRRVAEDGAVLARAVAAGACRLIRVGAARRCAALGRACDIHPRADLRGDRDDLREAVGE